MRNTWLLLPTFAMVLVGGCGVKDIKISEADYSGVSQSDNQKQLSIPKIGLDELIGAEVHSAHKQLEGIVDKFGFLPHPGTSSGFMYYHVKESDEVLVLLVTGKQIFRVEEYSFESAFPFDATKFSLGGFPIPIPNQGELIMQ